MLDQKIDNGFKETYKHLLFDPDFLQVMDAYKVPRTHYHTILGELLEYLFEAGLINYLDKRYQDISWLELSDGRLVDLDDLFVHFKEAVSDYALFRNE